MQSEKLKATPLPNGVVKAKTGNTTLPATYNNWYSSVYMPTAITGLDVSLSALTIGSTSLTPEFDPDVLEYTA